MPEVPSFDQLMWPAVLALKATGGSASNEELLEKVVDIAGIDDVVASIIHTDGRQSKLSYNLAWAKTYLKKAGLITNSQRGIWSLTDSGELVEESDLLQVPAKVRRDSYDQRRLDSSCSVIPDVDASADDPAADWKSELLTALRSVTPDAFERLSQPILREAGFSKVEVTGRSGDGGIDGVGILRINLLSFKTLFQCKRYAGSVGSGALRDFRGAMMGRSDKGLIITTGTFTADAHREATRDGAPAIELIDGEQLCALLKDLKLGIKVEIVEKIIVDAEWLAQI